MLLIFFIGRVQIISYETNSVIRTIDVSDVPVRAGRFIARKNWIVVGSDDFQIRVFNYNTSEKVCQFEAHPDYIRTLAVHPTQPILLSSGDDMTIKMWNWEMNWKLLRTFEGHTHYVMYVAFNPKDTNTFASACLDGTVKIWSLGSSTPNITFLAHETRGVNFVEYYPFPDKPYLITSSDDQTIRVWDYQMKSNVATLEGHSSNVSFAMFHPELPLIISGGEDNMTKFWNANTFKIEYTLDFGLDRAWCIACKKGTNYVALGYDAGASVLKIGNDEPTISMDPSGKVVWSKHSEVFSSVVKRTEDVKDGETLTLTQKDLGSVEVFPTQLIHSPNGRFVAVTGDGEYIIYTALAWRNKSFGSGVEFVWAHDSNEFAVRTKSKDVRVFKNFKERPTDFIDASGVDKIFGGALLGCAQSEYVEFFDWESGRKVRRVDVEAKQIFWSDSGELVTIATSDSFYILKFSRENFVAALQNGEYDETDGAEDSFEVIHDISDSIKTGKWVGDCFIYTTSSNKLNYLVGGEIYTINHFDKEMYLLGYIPRDDSVYLADKELNVTSYHLSLKLVEYQTVVLRGDMELASEILQDIPESEKSKVSRFLEAQGYTDLAMEVSDDPEQKFDLALKLGDFEAAKEIADKVNNVAKWRSLGDASLAAWNVTLAEQCFEKAGDLESLFLIYTSTGNKASLKSIADKAVALGKYNLAFNTLWYLKDTAGCVALLNKHNKSQEGALFALTYGEDPSKSIELWKKSLVHSGKKRIAGFISSPEEEPEKFPQNTKSKKPTSNGSSHAAPAESDNLIDVDDSATAPGPKTEEPQVASEPVESEPVVVQKEDLLEEE